MASREISPHSGPARLVHVWVTEDKPLFYEVGAGLEEWICKSVLTLDPRQILSR